MSVRTMARVWEHSQHGATELLMLLAIADFADDDGNAYPSVPTLARKCRMRVRNANYILAALQRTGELQVRKNEGPRGTNRYRIVLRGVHSVAGVQCIAGVQTSAGIPAKDCAKPLQRVADEPSLNHQEPLKKILRPRSSEEHAGFDLFWNVWPSHKRKADRQGCLKIWKSNHCEREAESILVKLEAWKRSSDWATDDGQYIPAPLVWLRGRRYEGNAPGCMTDSAHGWIASGV